MGRTPLVVAFLGLFICACGGGGGGNTQGSPNFFPQFNETPPADALSLIDPADDLQLAPEGAPAAVIPYPPCDLLRVYLWRSGNYLYLRAEFNGTIPTAPPVVAGEAVDGVSVSVYMDADSNYNTGLKISNSVSGVGLGVNILYGITMRPASQPANPAVASYDPGTAADSYASTLIGEFRGGGPGYNFACARYPLSKILGKDYVPGATATFFASAETASTHYHHFAYDETRTAEWVMP